MTLLASPLIKHLGAWKEDWKPDKKDWGQKGWE